MPGLNANCLEPALNECPVKPLGQRAGLDAENVVFLRQLAGTNQSRHNLQFPKAGPGPIVSRAVPSPKSAPLRTANGSRGEFWHVGPSG